MHAAQKRASGEPYFNHLFETAKILADYGVGSETIAAALLHDVLEDTEASERQIQEMFGDTVLQLVKGVTKLEQISSLSSEEEQIAYLQRVLVAATKDVRVLLIKLADKLHNMRTLQYLPKQKRLKIARQTLELYAPLAGLLGLRKIRQELEDLCFAELWPKELAYLRKELSKRRASKLAELDEMVEALRRNAKKMRKKFAFIVEDKGVYSIYAKMKKTNKELDEIYDFVVLVIVTRNVTECYEALRIVHSTFHPIPKKLKDYIALPKSRTYKAIHTSVIGPAGHPVKIYIRSEEMQALAESGVVYYLKSKSLREMEALAPFGPKLSLNGREFLEALKSELLGDKILVFDEKGRIFNMPSHSTVLDFAFMVAPKQAPKLSQCRVNGKRVKLWHLLETGDQVVLTFSRQIRLKGEWIDYANSFSARKKIAEFLKNRAVKKSGQRGIKMKLVVEAKDRIGLLSDISGVFAKIGINIERAEARSVQKGRIRDVFTFTASSERDVYELRQRILAIPGVESVLPEKETKPKKRK
jgi:GTP pyrophosphokinase